MADGPAEAPRRLTALATGLLCALLPALRPLVWDGDPASPANLALLVLLLAAAGLGLAEAAAGTRPAWRWSRGATVALLLLAWLAPAAWRAADPGEGRALWMQLAVHGLYAAWLLQVAPGRERLVQAGLVAGLGAEAVVALLQHVWVLPAIAAANHGGALTAAGDGVGEGDLAERVANGGLFGTFTLSNTLGAFLVLVLPGLAGAVLAARGLARLAAGAVLLLALAALAGTASKGAWVALALAAGGAWLAWVRGGWRWLPLAGAAAVGGLLAVWPAARAGLAASAEVRWGYWQGAWTLVVERPWTGWGLAAFSERSPGVLPLWAEPSRLVHNEPLEAAVSAGWPAALLLAALLAGLAVGRRRPADPLEPEAEAPPAWGLALAALLLTTYLGLLGAFEGQIPWWPGGGSVAGLVGWSLGLGALVAGLLVAGRALPATDGRWWRIGLAAAALHACIDFDLHAAAIVATLGAVAVLAAPAPRLAQPRWSVAVAAGLWAVLGIAVLWWAAGGANDRADEDQVRLLRAAATAEAGPRREALEALAAGRGEPPPPDAQAATALWQRTWAEALARSGDAPRRQLALLALAPPAPERLRALEELRGRLPASALLREHLAVDYARARRWDDALAAQAEAVALAPAHLPARRRLADLQERAAMALPSRAAALRAAAEAVRAEVGRLEAVVHPRNRE